MSFIEGIGDEVTLFFVIVIVFLLAALVTLIGSNPTLSSTRTRQSWREPPELGNESLRQTAIQRRRLGSSSRHSPNSEAINEVVNDINSDDTLNNFSDNQTAENDAVRNIEADVEISSSNVEDNSAPEDAEQQNPESATGSSLEDNVTRDDLELPNVPPDEIRVRLKYLDDTEKTVTTSLNTNIGDFKKKHFQDDLRSNKIVRLIFAGHLLNNSSTIQHCRILDNSVVHVQVLSAPTTQSTPVVNQETELDLGWILWPVLTVILSLCWLTYFKYPEFYNSLSLGILLLFSGCYFYFLSRIRH